MMPNDQKHFRPFADRGTGYKKPSRGYVGGIIAFPNHTRFNQTYPDATAYLEVSGREGADWLEVEVSEEFETAAGHVRSKTISLVLNRANRRALFDLLNRLEASSTDLTS